MQIHEITIVQEGFLDKLNDLKKAFGTPGAMTNTAKFNQLQQQNQSQRQTSDYVKKLAAEWLQVAKTMPQSTPVATTTPVTIKKAAPGQMPAGVAKSRQGQAMQQVYGKPKGGIQDMNSDLEESSNGNAFQKWVDGKMSAVIPGTRQQLNMDMVRSQFPDIGTQLSSALTRVEQAPTDPAAIEAYIMIAVQGMQRLSQQLKQQDPTLAKRSMSYELGPAQRNNNYVKTTNNPEADAALRAQGFIVQ